MAVIEQIHEGTDVSLTKKIIVASTFGTIIEWYDFFRTWDSEGGRHRLRITFVEAINVLAHDRHRIARTHLSYSHLRCKRTERNPRVTCCAGLIASGRACSKTQP